MQLRSVSETARSALILADALGTDSHKAADAMAFLQTPSNEVPMADYKYHANSIIETLETLQKDFKAMQVKVDEEEVASVKNFDLLTQHKSNEIKKANLELSTAKKHRSRRIDDIALASKELSTVEAMLLADKEYTNKLSQMCSDKATTWDRRSRTRADELAVLSIAIDAVTG